MADIVERLRSFDEELLNAQPWTCEQVAKEAADEIELRRREIGTYVLECADLREELERLRERCEAYKGQVKCGSDEIERLKEAKAKAESYMDQFAAEANEARTQALEEAARVAEAQAVKWESIGETNHAGVIAAAIRALKETK